MENKLSVPARFMSYVLIDEKTGAWLWQGGKTSAGYGGFWIDGKTVGAHRYAYEMKHGPIPDGLHVCHKYEVLGRHNVNPDHLFLGTISDNNKDAAKKGRTAYGEANGQRKLTEAQATEIRTSTETGAILASRYNISETVISKIKRGTAWVRTQGSPLGAVTIHSLRNKSGYRGVCWKRGAWEASITVTREKRKSAIYLGRHQDPADAAKAYDKAAIKYKGNNAKLNFPEQLL